MVNSHGVKTQYFFDAFGNEFASFTETGVLTRTQRRLSTHTFAGTPAITGLTYSARSPAARLHNTPTLM